MNTRKQVLVMSILLFSTMVILGIYAAWYPSRATTAEIEFANMTAERAALLFARNCRMCHGDVGEGGFAAGRMTAAPSLNRLELQAMVSIDVSLAENITARDTSIEVDNVGRISLDDVILIDDERMKVTGINGNTLRVRRGWDATRPDSHFSGAEVRLQDRDELRQQVELLTNTIACGRVGAPMPPWAIEHGGPLSPEQIRQLVVLITMNRWELARHEAEHEDETGIRLQQPLSADAMTMRVPDVDMFTQGEVIRIGTEKMRVTGVPQLDPRDPDRSGTIGLERGVQQTSAAEHGEGTQIYRTPEVPEPMILQRSCGQFARADAPTGEPSLIEPFEGQTVEIIARGLRFDQEEIRVQSNGQVRLRLDNQDAGVPHNIAVRTSPTDRTPVAPGSVGLVFNGPGVDDTVFDIPDPGTYFFICDIHPTTMTGDFIVQ
jgi:plastocyanin